MLEKEWEIEISHWVERGELSLRLPRLSMLAQCRLSNDRRLTQVYQLLKVNRWIIPDPSRLITNLGSDVTSLLKEVAPGTGLYPGP